MKTTCAAAPGLLIMIGLVVLAAWFGVTFPAVRLAIISATRVVQPVRPRSV